MRNISTNEIKEILRTTNPRVVRSINVLFTHHCLYIDSRDMYISYKIEYTNGIDIDSEKFNQLVVTLNSESKRLNIGVLFDHSIFINKKQVNFYKAEDKFSLVPLEEDRPTFRSRLVKHLSKLLKSIR